MPQLAGMAGGAARALEEILADRFEAEKLQALIAEREQQAAMERERLNETMRNNDFDRKRTERLDSERAAEKAAAGDAAASERRGLQNMAGVMSMGLDPQTAQREIAYSSRDPKLMMEAMKPPPGPKLRSVTARGPQGQPINRMVPETEDVEEYRAQPTGPAPDYEWVVGADGQPRQIRKGSAKAGDRPYEKPTAGSNALDPEKAREKGQTMLDVARSLRNHPGLANLTGARIGNPDYALGTQDEPIGGSLAADAAPYFNRLKALFTVDNIGLLKGVLSDSDMKILAQVGTSLDTKMRDTSFVGELDNVIKKLETALGGGQPGGGLPPMDATSSRGTGRGAAPSSRVDDLLKKYGGG